MYECALTVCVVCVLYVHLLCVVCILTVCVVSGDSTLPDHAIAGMPSTLLPLRQPPKHVMTTSVQRTILHTVHIHTYVCVWIKTYTILSTDRYSSNIRTYMSGAVSNSQIVGDIDDFCSSEIQFFGRHGDEDCWAEYINSNLDYYFLNLT